MKNDQGFIVALDQSGGSTPGTLALYGITEDSYSGEDQMYDLVHQMRSRIITSPAFDSQKILGTILFKQTMRSQIDGVYTADYLWDKKGVVPFLKIDNGLLDPANGVQLLKPIPELDELLNEARDRHIFGTKMRSVIKEYNEDGIAEVVDQQFELARRISAAGFVPIIEPEVDINAADKAEIEGVLRDFLVAALDTLAPDQLVMLKLTIPTEDDFYAPLIGHPNVVRVVALSGGYERDDANERLSRNHGLIASFNRALSEGLTVNQTDEEFNQTLQASVDSIYQASTT